MLLKTLPVFHSAENIVGKGENAGYQHFLPFPKCFQKAFSSRASKAVIVLYRKMLFKTSTIFHGAENIVRKGENAGFLKAFLPRGV